MNETAIDRLERVMVKGFDTLADLQRETNARLDQTNARLDQTNARLDDHEKLLVVLTDRVGDLTGEVKVLNGRFENFLTGAHGREHEELRERLSRFEKKLDRSER